MGRREHVNVLSWSKNKPNSTNASIGAKSFSYRNPQQHNGRHPSERSSTLRAWVCVQHGHSREGCTTLRKMYAAQECVSVGGPLINFWRSDCARQIQQKTLCYTCNDGSEVDGTTENLPMASKKSADSTPSIWRDVLRQPILLDSWIAWTAAHATDEKWALCPVQ